MSTDEEKAKLSKLLEGLEVVEVRLSERCSDLVKNFHQKFDKDVEEEEGEMVANYEVFENPYKPDAYLVKENEKKLKELWLDNRRSMRRDGLFLSQQSVFIRNRQEYPTETNSVEKLLKFAISSLVYRIRKQFNESVISTGADPKRPWRTHSNKEKLLRINNEIKYHQEKGSQSIAPMGEQAMKDLIKECEEETLSAPPVAADKLQNTVDAAKRSLPNFQYRKIVNTTATNILPTAHKIANENEKEPCDIDINNL